MLKWHDVTLTCLPSKKQSRAAAVIGNFLSEQQPGFQCQKLRRGSTLLRMRNDQFNTPFGSGSVPAAETLPVVIAYDSANDGKRAMQTLTGLISNLNPAPQLDVRLWRFTILEDPALQTRATQDVLRAAMLVVAADAEGGVPPSVAIWLEECLLKKRGDAHAVVALLDSPAGTDITQSSSFQFIERAASEAGAAFFSPGAGPMSWRIRPGSL